MLISCAQGDWRDISKVQNDGEEFSCGKISSIIRMTKGDVKRIYLEARSGRGKKRATWVDEMFMSLRDEFERIRKLGVKFKLKSLQLLAKKILSENTS